MSVAQSRRRASEVLARALTDRPEQVQVAESQHEGTTLIELFVAPGRAWTRDRQAGPYCGRASNAGGDGGREGRQDGHAGDPRRSTLTPGLVMQWEEMAVVGRVARPHGLRGQVIVNVETDFPEERFQPGAELFVNRRGRIERLTLDQRAVSSGAGRSWSSLASTRYDAAAALRRPRVAGPGRAADATARRDLLPPRVWSDVSVETAGGQTVGFVTDVERPGSTPADWLSSSGDDEIQIPLATRDLHDRGHRRRRIVIEPPDGLLDLNK